MARVKPLKPGTIISPDEPPVSEITNITIEKWFIPVESSPNGFKLMLKVSDLFEMFKK